MDRKEICVSLTLLVPENFDEGQICEDIENAISSSFATCFDVKAIYDYEELDQNNGDVRSNEWILCYTKGDADIWESVLGEDAMQCRVSEIMDETGNAAEDIRVFNASREYL